MVGVGSDCISATETETDILCATDRERKKKRGDALEREEK